MTLGTRLFTWLRGELVGADGEGNRYYRARRRGPGRRERRWVIYRGAAEASQVPTEWHGWLHHTIDEAPGAEPGFDYPWQKAHQPNRTGTPGAYRPPGHMLKGGRRDRATGDYDPWRPV